MGDLHFHSVTFGRKSEINEYLLFQKRYLVTPFLTCLLKFVFMTLRSGDRIFKTDKLSFYDYFSLFL